MIKGIGFDIVEVSRIEKATGDRFYKKNFTIGETLMFKTRNLPAETVAGNFAAKEAVLKCLGSGIFDMPLCDIEVLREPSGRPYVCLYGKAKERSEKLGIENIFVSISHTGGFAAAQAVAEGE